MLQLCMRRLVLEEIGKTLVGNFQDPQINIVLQKMQEDPSSINEFMKDQKIAEAINKLIAGGILKVGGR